MRKTNFFTVQRCLDPVIPDFGPPTTVEAESVIEAAEKALGGGAFAVTGAKSELAGRVLQLRDDYRTTATMIFRATPTAG